MRVAAKVEVSEEERAKLERWTSSRSAPVRLRERSQIVLKASSGLTNKEIAAELGLEVNKVGRWRKRYAEEGIAGIEKERARGGSQGGRSDAEREALRSRIVEATTTRLPRDATQWSCRSMAREVGVSRNFVNRTWRARGLKPHLSRTFKLSADPRFEEKLRDVVGLYLDPPENAAVFSFEEKSSIQALDRTQPELRESLVRLARRSDRTMPIVFAGREDEFRLLDVAVQGTQEGEAGHTVVIKGVPGAGKTTLLNEYANRRLLANDDGERVVVPVPLRPEEGNRFAAGCIGMNNRLIFN